MSAQDTLKRRIAPGIWEDLNGNIHWSIPELLALVQLEDTPENRAIVQDMLERLLRRDFPGITIISRDHPPT